MDADIINVVISDTHCGSDRAVFPPQISLPPLMADENERLLRYSNNQNKLYDHLMSCAKYVKDNFSGYKKVFTHNGDAIEGIHHHTIQLSAPMVDDHVEVHTNFVESRIAKHFEFFGAKFHDELKLTQHGRKIWFVHQWVGAGNGANEGNPLVNGMKNLYYNTLKEGREMPDVIVSSHFHKATSASWDANWKTYRAMITPSFQMKTRHGQKVSAFQRNDIGVGLVEVSKSGLVGIHEPLLMAQ